MSASLPHSPDHPDRTRLRLLGALATGAGLGLAGCATSQKPVQPPYVPPQRTPHDLGLRGSYGQREDVMQQVPGMARQLGLPEEYVRVAVGNADFIPSVQRLILPAGRGVRRNWRVYRSRFVEPIRIRAGVAFWQQNADTLRQAESRYGVPAKYVVGILGVETIFGRNMGNIRVIDALSTLSFDFPPSHPRAAERHAFFRNELEQYLRLTWKNHDDPLELRGSYAGAMGMPQFMPSSWAKYAVDFDHRGHIDLFHSPADAIGSVAHYFQQYGWVNGMPPEFEVTFEPQGLHLDTLLAPDIVPSFTPAAMAALGATPRDVPADFHGQLALIELQNGSDAPSYYAGTQNFYVITRYNNSSYYAQSVIDLGNAVDKAMRG